MVTKVQTARPVIDLTVDSPPPKPASPLLDLTKPTYHTYIDLTMGSPKEFIDLTVDSDDETVVELTHSEKAVEVHFYLVSYSCI